ncbi:MAG: ribose-5-phosphate isomerase [Nanoarchaeota archaeon]|nr:ribose-5-phosphate isomerase [Nanoarchaeota archaeon]MBU1703969.1 ribose-5-phosphate isomerase [Nanoarchaeota archaeon]
MKIVIGSDHAGYELKEHLKKAVKELGYDIEDKGTDNPDVSVDYPKFAESVAKEVANGKGKLGVLVCGTGMGVSIAANKVKGARAAVVYNEATAKLAREHNNANIICLGGRELSKEQGKKFVKLFIETPFSEDERHKRRIKEISDLEK